MRFQADAERIMDRQSIPHALTDIRLYPVMPQQEEDQWWDCCTWVQQGSILLHSILSHSPVYGEPCEFRLRIEVLLRRCGTNSLKQEKPYRYKLASCLTHLNHPHQNALLENFHTCLLRQLSLSLCTKPQRSMWILPGVQLIPEPKIPYEPHSPHLFYSILIPSSVFLLRILPCSVSPPFWPDTYDRLCLSVCLSLCMS